MTDGELAGGTFYRPTLLKLTETSRPIVPEGIFGPVLTMLTFSDEAEAIRLANDSEYGLNASVFSIDNDWAALPNQSEEGGYKGSGQDRTRGSASFSSSPFASTPPCILTSSALSVTGFEVRLLGHGYVAMRCASI